MPTECLSQLLCCLLVFPLSRKRHAFLAEPQGKFRFDREKLAMLLKIGLPLLPNFLIYWVYNSSDKWMITKILDAEETGTYAVASRIGHISNLIYKGDHYSYVIHTDIEQDFIVDDEYLWNMGDHVGLVMPIEKMSFSLKK